MTVLRDGDACWRGVYMGASNDLAIHWDTLTGLSDAPVLGSSSAPPARLRDTAMPGWADVGWRTIAAQNLQITTDDAIAGLVESMRDMHTVYAFEFADHSISDLTLMVAAVADRCAYPRNAVSHSEREYRAQLQWLAADCTIFSADTRTPASDIVGAGDEHEFVFTNDGNWASPSGRAWTLQVTADTAASNVYIRSETTGQIVTWQGLTVPEGAVLVLDEYRNSRIGALGLNGFPHTGSVPAPDWPISQPGSNTWVIGCETGEIVPVLTVRSTW